MMKIIKGLIITMYLIVYAYSVYMTSIEPERTIWGWICTVVFLIFAISAIDLINKVSKKESEDENKEG